MKNTLKTIVGLLFIVAVSSYEWSFGVAVVVLIVGRHGMTLLLDAEDRENARIERRLAAIDCEQESLQYNSWRKKYDADFKRKMEEEL